VLLVFEPQYIPYEYYEAAIPISQLIVVNILGIEVENRLLKVFPNPARSLVTIETSEPFQSIEIINEVGMSFNVNLNGNRIDLSHLPTGFYFLRIKSPTVIYFSKIVKL